MFIEKRPRGDSHKKKNQVQQKGEIIIFPSLAMAKRQMDYDTKNGVDNNHSWLDRKYTIACHLP